jgi:hypothetical protein
MGIKQICTAAYTPSTNGAVEGFHRYLAQGLSMKVNTKHSDWDEVIDDVPYRTAPIDGTTVSPFEMVYAREPNMPTDNILAEEADQDEKHRSKRRRLMTPEEFCGATQTTKRLLREKPAPERTGWSNSSVREGPESFLEVPQGNLPKAGRHDEVLADQQRAIHHPEANRDILGSNRLRSGARHDEVQVQGGAEADYPLRRVGTANGFFKTAAAAGPHGRARAGK